MRAWHIHYKLLEPMFFASRELGSVYLCEPMISSYAQPYALGLVRSRYRLPKKETTKPTYPSDLAPLNQAGIYITPATPTTAPSFRLERFNAMGETYWYSMEQGVVAQRLENRYGSKARAVNRPQQGQIRFIEPGSCFASVLLAKELPELPPYCRLGKFMSKARVEVESLPLPEPSEGIFSCNHAINPADLPSNCIPQQFDLLNVRPVPLLLNATFKGDFWKIGSLSLPQELAYRFSKKD